MGHTCSSGEGRVLDYYVASADFLPCLGACEAQLDRPLKPHLPVMLQIVRSPRAQQVRKLLHVQHRLHTHAYQTLTWEEACIRARQQMHTLPCLVERAVLPAGSQHLAQHVTDWYQQWSYAAEAALFPPALHSATHRGQEPRIVNTCDVPALPTHYESQSADPRQALWAIVSARLRDLELAFKLQGHSNHR